MIKGLVGSGPPLGLIAPDSKDLETEIRPPGEFKQVLEKKEPKVESTSSEPKAERSDPEPGKPTESKKSVDTKVRSQRERVIRKFMDSIEGEFGIPPQKMVEAMSQLSAKEMELAPQKTVNQVIEKLGLDSAQAGQVRQLYKGLLQQLQQIEVRAQLPTATDTLLSQLTAERQVISQNNKANQSHKVQDFNREFWMQPKSHQIDQVQPEALPMADMGQALDLMQSPRGEIQDFVGLEKLNPESKLKTVEELFQLVKEKVPEVQLRSNQLQVQEVKQLGPESMAIPFMPRRPEVNPQVAIKPSEDIEDLSAEGMQVGAALEAPVNPESFELSLMKRMLGLSKASEEQEEKPKVKSSEDLMAQLISSDSRPLEKFELGSNAQVSASSPNGILQTPAQKAESMQNLMNQAQVLIQKGGGEMKVEMSPEGMGSVQMKLKVIDGKVQLQMAAESKEVKKLIENSIQDLKSSLATHNLAVDQVRVDVVHQSMGSSDVRQDLQGQMNEFLNQQQRDGTRQFWQQFNENFGNRQARESYYDAQNIRRGPTEQTLPGFSNSSSPRVTGTSRGKSLNLVA